MVEWFAHYDHRAIRSIRQSQNCCHAGSAQSFTIPLQDNGVGDFENSLRKHDFPPVLGKRSSAI